jgi:hypothetical protein
VGFFIYAAGLALAVVVVGLGFTTVNDRVRLRRWRREELAHLHEVARMAGGKLVDDHSGVHVVLEAAGLACIYGELPAVPSGLEVRRSLTVRAAWIDPTFGVWHATRVDAAGRLYRPFRTLPVVPPPGDGVSIDWTIVAEESDRGRKLWERIRGPLAECLPYLDGVSGIRDGNLRFYLRESTRPPPAVIRMLAEVVPLVRDCLKEPPKATETPFRD